MHTTLRPFFYLAFILLVTASEMAQGRGSSKPGTGDTTTYFVPWKYLEAGVEPDKQPLVIEWLPASRDEIKKSALQYSAQLLDYAGHCVGLQVVLPEDRARIEKLGATSQRPMVLLLDSEGKVLRRVENHHGTVSLPAVEKMVKDELDIRGDLTVGEIESARAKVASGDKKAAIDIYMSVWQQRCLFPFAAHEAQRGLKDLGVTVSEPKPAAATPAQSKPPVPTPPPSWEAVEKSPRSAGVRARRDRASRARSL